MHLFMIILTKWPMDSRNKEENVERIKFFKIIRNDFVLNLRRNLRKTQSLHFLLGFFKNAKAGLITSLLLRFAAKCFLVVTFVNS